MENGIFVVWAKKGCDILSYVIEIFNPYGNVCPDRLYSEIYSKK
jgi:hypothetical protein